MTIKCKSKKEFEEKVEEIKFSEKPYLLFKRGVIDKLRIPLIVFFLFIFLSLSYLFYKFKVINLIIVIFYVIITFILFLLLIKQYIGDKYSIIITQNHFINKKEREIIPINKIKEIDFFCIFDNFNNDNFYVEVLFVNNHKKKYNIQKEELFAIYDIFNHKFSNILIKTNILDGKIKLKNKTGKRFNFLKKYLKFKKKDIVEMYVDYKQKYKKNNFWEFY